MDAIKEAMIRDDDGLSPAANTALTPMGEAARLVDKWHQEYFGLKIRDDKLGELTRRIAELLVNYTNEALRNFEDYNGKHQLACMEIEKLTDILTIAGFRRCDIPACNCGSWHPYP